MNKLIIHYAGGCGINIARDINKDLESLGEGFCEIVPKYLDTSTNNINGIDESELWLIGSTDYSEHSIDGSGGERRTNAPAIMVSVRAYLDSNDYKSEITGVYHIVVFSASGGTGSVVAPTLISSLRERSIPVLGIVIGDSSNGLCCKNTLNTIAGLDSMAKKAIKKPVTVIYYNNHTVKCDGRGDREGKVNSMVLNALTIMSLFLSGANEDIDSRDMVNFLAPDNYKTISVAPSLYCITIHTGDNIINDDDSINLIGRTLVAPDQDSEVTLTLLQHKYGRVINANAVAKVKSITPIHLVLTGNHLNAEHARLTNTVEEYANISAALTTSDLDGTSDADDTGMIF